MRKMGFALGAMLMSVLALGCNGNTSSSKGILERVAYVAKKNDFGAFQKLLTGKALEVYGNPQGFETIKAALAKAQGEVTLGSVTEISRTPLPLGRYDRHELIVESVPVADQTGTVAQVEVTCEYAEWWYPRTVCQPRGHTHFCRVERELQANNTCQISLIKIL